MGGGGERDCYGLSRFLKTNESQTSRNEKLLQEVEVRGCPHRSAESALMDANAFSTQKHKIQVIPAERLSWHRHVAATHTRCRKQHIAVCSCQLTTIRHCYPSLLHQNERGNRLRQKDLCTSLRVCVCERQSICFCFLEHTTLSGDLT